MNKLMDLASIGSMLANVTLLRRFLTDVTGVIALTVLSALMGSLLVAASLCGIYIGLTHYGLDPVAGLFTVIALAFLLTAGLALATVRRVRMMREFSYHGLPQDVAPPISRLGSIANAFFEGLTARHTGSDRR